MLSRRFSVAFLNVTIACAALYVYEVNGSMWAALGSAITGGVAVAMLLQIVRDLLS